MIILLPSIMGVKNLNVIIQTYNHGIETPKKFNTMVIDGNNMIISFLSSAAARLDNDMDITTQTRFLLRLCYSMIIEEIDNFVCNLGIKTVWFVFDPNSKVRYFIDPNIFVIIDKEALNDAPVRTMIGKTVTSNIVAENENNIPPNTEVKKVLELGAKDAEHEKRSKTKQNTVLNTENDEEREYYGYKNINMLHNLLRTIQHSLINYSRFSLGANTLDEEEDYLNKAYKPKYEYKFYTARSETNEADFLIKNICENTTTILNVESNDENNILVVSKDTDYKVLLSDLPNVWISDLRYRSPKTYINPMGVWRNFLEPLDIPDEYIYYYVIRIAPLIGNDYTTGSKSIIVLDKNKFSKNSNLGILRMFRQDIDAEVSPTTNLGKFLKNFDYNETLEENLHNYDPDMYKNYIRSVTLYTNYKQFDQYYISTKQNNFDENIEFIYKNILVKHLKRIPSVKNVKEFVKKFYELDKDEKNDIDCDNNGGYIDDTYFE